MQANSRVGINPTPYLFGETSFVVAGFIPAFWFQSKPHMKLHIGATVGRATVPAETDRHGGRPYDSARPKFLFRFDWTLAASGAACMKLHLEVFAGSSKSRLKTAPTI